MRPGDLETAYSCPDCGTGPELDHGRPGYRLHQVPAGLRLGLSLSRSHGWALLAAGPVRPAGAAASVRPAGAAGSVRPAGAAGVTIGVDLEHSSGVLFPGFDDVALTPAERQLLAALSPEQATLWRTAAWARKEAVLKARGTGLRIEPSSVEAYGEPVDGTILVDLDTVALGLPPGFAGALAVVGVEQPPSRYRHFLS